MRNPACGRHLNDANRATVVWASLTAFVVALAVIAWLARSGNSTIVPGDFPRDETVKSELAQWVRDYSSR